MKRKNKTAATPEQKEYFEKVVEVGCLACLIDGRGWVNPNIHHWREYGYRNHDLVFGICDIHHLAVRAKPGIPNRHLKPVEFAEKYGTDEELYNKCKQIIEGKIIIK